MDKLIERHKLLKLTQEEKQNLNRPLTSKEIELVTLKCPTKKSSGLRTLLMNATICLKKN